MASRADSTARRSYLVEHYGPGRQVEELRRSVARVRAAIVEMERAGAPITYVRSTIAAGRGIPLRRPRRL